MKKISLALLILIIVGICIPVVSANVLYDDIIDEYDFTGTQTKGGRQGNDYGSVAFDGFEFTDIAQQSDLSYIVIDYPEAYTPLPEGINEINYVLNGVTKTGRIHVYYHRNLIGQITATRHTFFFDNWDIGTLSGSQTVSFTPSLAAGFNQGQWQYVSGDPFSVKPSKAGQNMGNPITITCSSGKRLKNRITISEESNGNTLLIQLQRVFEGRGYASNLNIYSPDEVIFSDYTGKDLTQRFLTRSVDRIEVFGANKLYTYPIGDVGGSDTSVTIYVRNSQTNTLIADAHILISANVNDNFHEVINETLPGGIYKGPLQPTGGGMPNPDYYRLIATAEGYNSIMPYIDFEVGQGATIYAYLEPVGGAPENENNTFVDFYVRDLAANPISGATVNFGGYTLITNSAGYTIFEVKKDSTYSWVVSKSGYGSLTGNAVIGNNARHTINTVIAPAVTPTTPTAIPTSTSISPTPAMTAPNGEPVSNWLEWFAAHFGMILGGGVEIGKIFMWLCFTVPVGVYVGKEAKAGAAGFMAGAGIVTLFFVLIGWVPIWIVVLLALIIGLLYAKVFNNSDNGGGR